MVINFPETTKHGKYMMKLVRDSGSGKVLIRTLYQFARFATHLEAQGYIVGRKQLEKGKDAYAVYISTTTVPKSEQKVELSKMHGKMAGVGGLNTATNLNAGCRAAFRGKSKEGCDPTICNSCYSFKGLI